MNREELIEEAAKAILRADNEFDFNEGQSEDSHWLRALAEAALAVFEQAYTPPERRYVGFAESQQAYTPTDDERAALDRVVREVTWNASNYPRRAQPHILGADIGPLTTKIVEAVEAAGFRRTVQGEPTDRTIVMCAKCGLFPVVANDQINSDIAVCDRCAFAEGRESVQGETTGICAACGVPFRLIQHDEACDVREPTAHRFEGESDPIATNPILRGVDLALERLVRRDCFTERTMRIVDELRAEVLAATQEGERDDAEAVE